MYKEQIETLRSYGLGLEVKTPYEELIEWLKTHDGKMPLSFYSKDGKGVIRANLTEAEREEVNLRTRWTKSKERKILEACRRNTNR